MAVIDPVKRLEALLAKAEPAFRRAFLSMISAIRSERTLQELATLLVEGRTEEALAFMSRASSAIGAQWTETFIFAGRDTAKQIGDMTGEVLINFDAVNERAVSAMRENQLRLIQEFTQQQRRATRAALLDGIQRGLNPRDQARVFRDSIGLTTKQVGAVNNYRRMLENLDRQALRGKLRDARFDRTVRTAIQQDQPLSNKQIDTMVDRYRQRAIKHRSEVIARTEALRSTHQGAAAMYQQAVAEGVLAADQIVRIWNTAADERVRSSHATMHGQQRPMGIPFTSGKGNLLMHPGDPSAPAEETIQCRCVESTRILSLSELQGLLSATIIG